MLLSATEISDQGQRNIVSNSNSVGKLQPLTTKARVVLVALAEEQLPLEMTLNSIAQASPDNSPPELVAADTPELRALAQQRGLAGQFCLPLQVDSLQLIYTVLSSMGYDGAPLILLRAGCQVPQSWIQRLCAAHQRAADALAISPLSARHPLLKAFVEPAVNPGLDVNAVDQWLNDYARGVEFDVPAMLESCALIAGEAWVELLQSCQSSDLCLYQQARKRGHLLLACDHLYVDDSTVPGLGACVSQLPTAVIDSLSQPHSLLNWRHPLSELSARGEQPAYVTDSLPVQLHLAHSWGGGLGRWVEDYLQADSHYHNLVLRPVGDWGAFGKTMALYRGADMDVPLASWTLTYPIVSSVIASHQYQQIIAEIMSDYRVESVMISSLIGTSLDSLQTGLPTTVVFHDFFPYCPALVATFGVPCSHCDAEQHRQCRQNNPHHRYFLHEDTDHWDHLRERYVELIQLPNVRLVAPSESVAQRYQELVPAIANKGVTVIPHGLSTEMIAALKPVREHSFSPAEKLNVVILGSLATQKGADLLTEMIEPLSQFAQLHLIGCGEEGERFADSDGVLMIPRYERDELPGHLINASADVGLLLSVVPETFSYTLSEFWAAGIPVVATRIGAFADRVKEGDNGWLSELTPEAMLASLQFLNDNREQLLAVRAKLCADTVYSSKGMADQYHALAATDAAPSVSQYLLGRRSYKNCYRDFEQTKALHINHQAPYRQILCEFLEYSYQKSLHSPRLRPWQRNTLCRTLLWFIQRLRREM